LRFTHFTAVQVLAPEVERASGCIARRSASNKRQPMSTMVDVTLG